MQRAHQQAQGFVAAFAARILPKAGDRPANAVIGEDHPETFVRADPLHVGNLYDGLDALRRIEFLDRPRDWPGFADRAEIRPGTLDIPVGEKVGTYFTRRVDKGFVVLAPD